MTKLPLPPSRTTTGFAFSIVDRSIREGVAERRFRKTEMKIVLEYFSVNPPECVYCGSNEVGRWDHLIPIRKGGDTVVGNMVPSCSRCDDSKQHLEFESWMVSDAKYSPRSLGVVDVAERISQIKAYMAHFGYRPKTIEERLSEDERRTLDKIQLKLSVIRNELERLIEDHRNREAGR